MHQKAPIWEMFEVITNTEDHGDFLLVPGIQEQGVLCCDGEKLISELHQLCQLLQFLWEATPWHQDQIWLLAAYFSDGMYFGTDTPVLHLLAIPYCNIPSMSCSKAPFEEISASEPGKCHTSPFLWLRCPHPTGPTPRSLQRTHLSWPVGTGPSTRNLTSFLTLLSPVWFLCSGTGQYMVFIRPKDHVLSL